MKTAAIVCAATMLALTGCMSALMDNDIRRRIREDPRRAAYARFADAARNADRVLKDARITYNANWTDARVLNSKIGWAYRYAATDALGFAQDVYPDATDMARVRATTDARIREAADTFATYKSTVQKWCDNYSQIEAAVEFANALGQQAIQMK